MTSSTQLTARIASVVDLFSTMTLAIPSYQRPYTWTVRNATQLVSDIRRFRPSGHYRIGTFILHSEHPPGAVESGDRSQGADRDDRDLNVVDGQQRYLTFALIAAALATRSEHLDADHRKAVSQVVTRVRIPVRNDGRSSRHLRENYRHLKQLVSGWAVEELRDFTGFFLTECSVVVLTVDDLDAAFQMFDSQNTRGRALYPTDLLKAYHLREFSQTDPDRSDLLATVQEWESVSPEEINHVIAEILFRVKMWTDHQPIPRKGFTSQHIDLFKGVKEGPGGNGAYRWTQQALLAQAAVDRFRQDNSTLLRHEVVEPLEYPHQISQPVIDGEGFFRMVHHYVREARRAGVRWSAEPPGEPSKPASDPALTDLLGILDRLPDGTGNRYVRELFDCFLIAYLDRFGWHSVSEAAYALARHTFLLRLRLERVQVGSVDRHALSVHPRVQEADENLFAQIAQARHPQVVLSRSELDPGEIKPAFAALADLYTAADDDGADKASRRVFDDKVTSSEVIA